MIRVEINNADDSTQTEVRVNPDRFLPSRRLIRQQLDAGKLGDVGLVRLHRWEPPPSASAEDIQGLPEPLCRDLDVVLWLVGKSPLTAYAVEQISATNAVGRFLSVHLGFPDGAMALIDFTNRLPSGDGYQSLSVIGSAGAAYADDHQNMQLAFRGGAAQAQRTEETKRQQAVLVQESLADLRAGRNVSESLAAWRNLLRLADAVKRSLESRQSVSVEGC